MTQRKTYRVIAEGCDSVASGLTAAEAVLAAQRARASGKKHVAIVDEATHAIVNERDLAGRA